ncbi:arsenate reductase [Gillisia mitskevichiae]|uniref:Arsenate reductase n=1 Tax=Gillisia mitskevichiae TaxID=270921 RepID=A0A495PSW5_9FLAO|nr:protein-tyrosine-phosphatase [Gillisia mitskevichiae]RKS53066.1 arsenate reductase [Gillisia mitskevichiae]
MTLPKISEVIKSLDISSISKDRKRILAPLIAYIQEKLDTNKEIKLNFICTHNSRRSHFSQVWAQAIAAYFNLNKVVCYSGGTEATALYPMVAETLKDLGFVIKVISKGSNPIYNITYSEKVSPINAFSKTFDSETNPKTEFAAILTCSDADENCPLIKGAEIRIPITYEDPKVSDGTPNQKAVYKDRSLQIATEMKYVFSEIKSL